MRIIAGAAIALALAALYASTGHLVAQRFLPWSISTDVFAVLFDLETLQTSGETVGLLENAAVFAMSKNGTLLIGTSVFTPRLNEAVWVDRDGGVTPVDTTWRFYLDDVNTNYGWALSPDGSRLAIGLGGGGGRDIWIKQLDEGPKSRLTSGETNDYRPQWSSDGTELAYIVKYIEKEIFVVRSLIEKKSEFPVSISRYIF